MDDKTYSMQNSATLDLALSKQDFAMINKLDTIYRETAARFPDYVLHATQQPNLIANEIIEQYASMGKMMQTFLADEKRIVVYPFTTPRSDHAEASRVISKLRDINTRHAEFVYYTQRAYEMLFKLMYDLPDKSKKNYFFTQTPVDVLYQNFAVHKLPDIEPTLSNTVMCVMLRGSLLPSMIISKEIQEYTSHGYVTPFMLFDIKRHTTNDGQLNYYLDLAHSYLDLSEMDGKDLIFADPMNATTGSFFTIVKYIQEQGVVPRRILFMNIISSFLGALRAIRNISTAYCYALWIDPTLNEHAYIVPGLGDAGDRLNGVDPPGIKRNVVELIADYGSSIANLYRSQIRAIESSVLR